MRFSTIDLARILNVSEQAIRKRFGAFTKYKRLKGKGWEYELSDLPPEIQEIIRQQEEKCDHTQPAYPILAGNPNVNQPDREGDRYLVLAPGKSISSSFPEDREECDHRTPPSPPKRRPPEVERGEESTSHPTHKKAAAIVEILHIMKEWCEARNFEKCNCREAFAIAYNRGEISTPSWVKEQIKTLSSRSLIRWEKSDLTDLMPKYGKSKGKTKIDRHPEMMDLIETKISQGSMGYQVLEALVFKFGHHNIDFSLKTLERWIFNWKKENPVLADTFISPEKARGLHGSKIGTTASDYPNQEWQLDSTLADIDLFGKRYALLAGIDNYSCRLRFYLAVTSSGEAITCLMARLIRVWGIPEVIRVDNGKDYVSDRVRIAIAAFPTQRVRCLERTPTQKARIENAFGLINNDLFSQLLQFIGRNVTERQNIRAKQRFEKSLYQGSISPGELQQLIDEWTLWYENQHIHGELGMTPLAKWHEGNRIKPAVRLENERDLDILLAPAPKSTFGLGMRKVEGGVIHCGSNDYINAKLMKWSGRRVHVRYSVIDPASIAVFEDESLQNFLCVATAKHLNSAPALRIEAGKAHQEEREIKAKAKEIMRRETPSVQEIQAYRNTSNVIPLFSKRTAQLQESFSIPAVTEATEAIESIRKSGKTLPKNERGGDRKDEKSIPPPTAENLAPSIQLRGDSDFIRLLEQLDSGKSISTEDKEWILHFIEQLEGLALLEYLGISQDEVQERFASTNVHGIA